MTRFVTFCALTALLTACAGPTTLGPPRREAATWSEMVYATSRGPMLVQVVGNPFGSGTIAPDVAAIMSRQVPTRPFDFTSNPTEALHPDKRMVVAFDPALTSGGYDLCINQPSAGVGRAGEGRVRVLAAFCDHAQPLSVIKGWVDDVASPTDPRFTFLLKDVTRQIFGTESDVHTEDGAPGGWW